MVFETTRSAKACVAKFDQTNKMGNTMTVFTDPLGKERQGYIDEKVYGIPRRQVDISSEFIPRPEVYVDQPAVHLDNTHSPHVPTEHPPLPPPAEQEDCYSDDSNAAHDRHSTLSMPDDYLEPDSDYFSSREPRSNHRYSSKDIEFTDEERSESSRQRWNRGHSRDPIRDHPRDKYMNSHWPPQHMPDRDMLPSYDQRGNDRFANSRTDYSGHDRVSRYARGHHANRHFQDPEHFWEKEFHHSHHTERDRNRHLYLDTGPPMSNRHSYEQMHEPPPSRHQVQSVPEHVLHERAISGKDQLSHEQTPPVRGASPKEPCDESHVPSDDEALPNAEQSDTPVVETPSESAPLDLDSRIQMMLNMNKDLAGFGAPEPVPASPVEPAPPAPLEPPMNRPPPIDYSMPPPDVRELDLHAIS